MFIELKDIFKESNCKYLWLPFCNPLDSSLLRKTTMVKIIGICYGHTGVKSKSPSNIKSSANIYCEISYKDK